METKLTLRLNESIIENAKEYARAQNVELTPLVKELSGVMKVSTDFDYKKDYSDYLENKYQ